MGQCAQSPERLKLLLNQRDPAAVGRMMAYYGYFGRARAERITSITEHLAHLELLGEAAEGRPYSHRQAMLEFAMKFQQVTAPVTAKGVEDTSRADYISQAIVCEIKMSPV